MRKEKIAALILLWMAMIAVLPAFASTPNNVSVTYSFDESAILSWLDYGTPIKGILTEAVDGEPVFLYRVAWILLPAYTEVAEVSVQISEARLHDVIDIPCGQPACMVGEEATTVEKNPAVYNSDELYPSSIFEVGSVESYHGYQVLRVQLHPVQYRPVSMKALYYPEMTLCVSLSPCDTMPTFRKLDEERDMVENMVDNPEALESYDSMPAYYDPFTTTYEYLIITNIPMLDEFQVLANWKARWVNGARVETVSAGVSATEIKNIIRDYHNYYGTLYVLLGGDVGIIPYHTKQVMGDNIVEDYWFANLHGDDEISTYDVYIGRAPVDNEAEAGNFASKVISFEQTPAPTANLFHQSRAGHDNIPDSRQLAWQCEQYVPVGYTNYEIFEENGRIEKANWVNFWRNNGILCEHMGHGSPTSYYINYEVGGGPVAFTTTDVAMMDNTYWPVHTSVACHSGEFEYSDCLAEAFVKDDRGAIACLMNDKYGWYSYGDATKFSGDFIEMQFKALYQDGYQKIGPMLAFSKYYFNDEATDPNNPNRAVWEYCWREINLLGDPETPLLTKRVNPPTTPSTPSGPASGYVYTSYTYTTSTTDPEGHNIYYEFNWGDGTTTTVGPYASGANASASHPWKRPVSYQVKVRAKDIFGAYSGWSNSTAVTLGQNDANSEADAGNSQATAITVSSSGTTYYGTLYPSNPLDKQDYYNFTAQSGQYISIYMSVPAGVDFDMQLFDPIGNLRATSKNGVGIPESIYLQADRTGKWTLYIYQFIGEGQYWFYTHAYWSGGGCPYFWVYNGQEYINEGLINIHDADGIDITANHYLITTPKATRGTYQIRLVEHPQTISSIDQVKLYAVLADKTLIELPLIWAWHSENGFVLPQLLFSDDWKSVMLGAEHNGGTSQSINLRFLALPPGFKVSDFLFVIEGNNQESKPPVEPGKPME